MISHITLRSNRYQHVWTSLNPWSRWYNWPTNQQQRHCDPWMDRESCVFECVFLLTDNQTHYDGSATTVGFSDLMKWSLMSHSKSLIWMRAWHENHGTEQGGPCLSAGVRARCRAKPSLFEVRSGQVNTPGLSQSARVSKRSWQQTEGCSSGLQANPNVKKYRTS